MKAKQLRKEMLSKSDTFINTHIKIQGSVFDKKRKLTDRDIQEILKMRKKGMSLDRIAKKFNVSVFIIHYHTSEVCRAKHLLSRNGIHYGKTVNYTLENRIARKKKLVKTGKVDKQLEEVLC